MIIKIDDMLKNPETITSVQNRADIKNQNKTFASLNKRLQSGVNSKKLAFQNDMTVKTKALMEHRLVEEQEKQKA